VIFHHHADPFADLTHWGFDGQAESHVFGPRRIFKHTPVELGRVQAYILLIRPVYYGENPAIPCSNRGNVLVPTEKEQILFVLD